METYFGCNSTGHQHLCRAALLLADIAVHPLHGHATFGVSGVGLDVDSQLLTVHSFRGPIRILFFNLNYKEVRLQAK